jgi:hypothetical protein
MPALMKAFTYITVHYRNDIHLFTTAWTASNLGYAPFGMKCILALHIRHAESTRIAKRGDITTHDMFILNRACHPSYDFIRKAHV